MRRIYARELSFHSVESLSALLGFESEETLAFIDTMASRGILRPRTDNDICDYDTDVSGQVWGTYQFVFVGLVIYHDILLILYPKYISESEPPLKKLKQIFSVLRKASKDYSDITAASDDVLQENNHLALMLALMESYDGHGIYSNYVRTKKLNGPGMVSWERTIASMTPFISDGTPVYYDYETIETSKNSSDFITMLHECVLTECSSFLSQSGVMSLLGIDEIDLSASPLEEFGTIDYIVYRIEQEQSQQYVTWKQDVLALLLRYIKEKGVHKNPCEVACFGTTSFYHLWETACKVAFGDCLNRKICNVVSNLSQEWAEDSQKTLLEILPKPVWKAIDERGNERDCGSASTLIPDIVTIWDEPDQGLIFAILDAKYYTPRLAENLAGIPGVGSVTKQILYQSAYKKFISDNGFKDVINAFIVPAEETDPRPIGVVRFPGVFAQENKPFCNGVTMYSLPAEDVFNAYLSNKSLDIHLANCC